MAPRGRRPTDEKWLEEVRKYHGAKKDVKAAEVLAYLVQAGKAMGWDDVPKIHTVRRLLVQAANDPPEIRSSYQEVFWPESFEDELLPWEASESFFELLRLVNSPGDFFYSFWEMVNPDRQPRPDLKTALWFYRLALAFPNNRSSHAGGGLLMNMARLLGAARAALPSNLRSFELTLAGVPFENIKPAHRMGARDEKEFLEAFSREAADGVFQRGLVDLFGHLLGREHAAVVTVESPRAEGEDDDGSQE